jgi:phosphatidylinositol phospholipase C gamma-1
LKEHFQEVDTRRTGEIGLEGFTTFYTNLIHDNKIFYEYFTSYSNDRKRITAQEMTAFLAQEQKDQLAEDERNVCQLMKDFLRDPNRNSQEPYFTLKEFINFLFSKQNEIWDSRHDIVNQDMNRPLTHYWIASSHNTYLTGDQVRSESSIDAYARCLRMGCRCIERKNFHNLVFECFLLINLCIS